MQTVLLLGYPCFSMKQRYVRRWNNDFQTSEHRDEIKKSGSGMAVRIVCIELKTIEVHGSQVKLYYPVVLFACGFGLIYCCMYLTWC
jgi:uncharacterized membrane protein YiaA